jgi:hypothetical protein
MTAAKFERNHLEHVTGPQTAIVSAIKELCLEGEEPTAQMKRFPPLLIHVAGRMNRNNRVMGLRPAEDWGGC